MAKKKKVIKKKKKVTAKKKKGPGSGRTPGAKTHVPKGLEVRSTTPLSRGNASEPQPGLKRLILETIDPDHALRLQRLASLVKKRDKGLLKLITPPARKKRKAA